ncbi:MAG: hypothetical protein WAO55_09420 [Candidatus Manganitrophaceae bacterium]
MDEQRIQKETRPVLFHLSDGGDIRGMVFLRMQAEHHSGIQKVGELLNEDRSFIPVKMDVTPLLLNKRHIVAASVPGEEERDDLLLLGKQYSVAVTTSLGATFHGEVFVNMPEGFSRMKDYLNGPGSFITLIQPESILYINRRFILTVKS